MYSICSALVNLENVAIYRDKAQEIEIEAETSLDDAKATNGTWTSSVDAKVIANEGQVSEPSLL